MAQRYSVADEETANTVPTCAYLKRQKSDYMMKETILNNIVSNVTSSFKPGEEHMLKQSNIFTIHYLVLKWSLYLQILVRLAPSDDIMDNKDYDGSKCIPHPSDHL